MFISCAVYSVTISVYAYSLTHGGFKWSYKPTNNNNYSNSKEKNE